MLANPLGMSRFTLLLAVYFVLVINLPLAARLVTILQHTEGLSLGMVLSLPLFFGSVFYLLFSFWTFRYLARPFAVLLLLASSLVSYAMYYYGTVFDMEMIRNLVETNPGEARAYLNANLALWWLFTGVVPAVIFALLPLRSQSLARELGSKLLSMTIAVAVVLGVAALYYKDYASLGRNNRELNKLIIPTHYLYSAGKFVSRTYLATPRAHQALGEDALVADRAHNRKKRLTVLVLGETARARNFELNGYPRPTNAFTRDLGMVSFQQVASCGTATAVSVPCLFSRLDRSNYDPALAKTQDNLLDVLQHAGVQVRWLENDGGCKGVCARVPTQAFEPRPGEPFCEGEYCQDEVLLGGLQAQLAALEQEDTLIVLHLAGSHGPTYNQRYPDAFRRFTPDCPRSDIQNCSDLQIVNSYDNTLYYDDYVMSRVIAQLAEQPQWQTSLLYVSDHGESLGENGMYLHGMPYALAPAEQTHVPMLLWMSPEFSSAQGYDGGCVARVAAQQSLSHDNVFDAVLGLMRVKTGLYRAEHDMLSPCRQVALVAQAHDNPDASPALDGGRG
ncbi:MAG: phosphoethanolamine--lipid A transferase [Halieaceae bacterium]|uniref:phosphoethanolamine transferase n=1 Tax=Haliea alexandrii TaxID=2448162 RepID=UPI000F0B7DA5|nr:phosphoethanolamine--lipid A transferase [Haliea alexandrii]MCR9185445.1 phosphoethanolamine--lipid A transferase [Halieaceae bacterium]